MIIKNILASLILLKYHIYTVKKSTEFKDSDWLILRNVCIRVVFT